MLAAAKHIDVHQNMLCRSVVETLGERKTWKAQVDCYGGIFRTSPNYTTIIGVTDK